MIEMQGKKFEEKEIMKIQVSLIPNAKSELKGRGGRVVMLPFTGTAEGEIFKGEVLPGACDTQVENLAMVRHMSARYMMKGVDCFGTPCHIYIENNGYFTDGQVPRPFTTVPTFYTDSDKLATYLHTNQFITRGYPGENGPTICVYELQEITTGQMSDKELEGWPLS